MMEKNTEAENKRKKRVLFVCTHNASRSQMAEGLLRALRGELYDVYSAGTAPTGVHPGAVQAMAEIGIDIRGHHAKGLDAFRDVVFDEVVTVCDHAQETCPVVPGGGVRRHQGFASFGGKGDGGGGSCGFPAGPGRDPGLDYGNLLKRRRTRTSGE